MRIKTELRILRTLPLWLLLLVLSFAACTPVEPVREEPLAPAAPDSPPVPPPEPAGGDGYEEVPEEFSGKEPDWAARYAYWRGMALNYFKAPVVGQRQTITLTSGINREGLLAEAPTNDVTLQIEDNLVTLPKTTLNTETRLRLFPEDYAHFHAMRKVNEEREAYLAERRVQEENGTVSVDSASDDANPAPAPARPNGEPELRPARISRDSPRNDSKDASVWQVKEYMKRTMRNYETVRFLEWSRVVEHENGYSVRCMYTVHTDSFGTITENKVFFMNPRGRVVRTAAGTQGLRLGELNL